MEDEEVTTVIVIDDNANSDTDAICKFVNDEINTCDQFVIWR